MPLLSFISFFDDTKNFGLALIVAGAVGILLAVVLIVLAVMDPLSISGAIVSIGSVITSLLLLLYGMNVRGVSNSLSSQPFFADFVGVPSTDKPGLLTGLVRVMGISSVIGGIFSIVAELAAGGFGIVSGIVSILCGLFLLWAAPQIIGDSQGIAKNILWIIFVLIFVVLALVALLGTLLGLLAIFSLWFLALALQSLCLLIAYIFALVFLFSPEVKSKMCA